MVGYPYDLNLSGNLIRDQSCSEKCKIMNGILHLKGLTENNLKALIL